MDVSAMGVSQGKERVIDISLKVTGGQVVLKVNANVNNNACRYVGGWDA